MQLSLKQLLHLPVETKSGVRLGEVCGFEVDAERHVVAHYVVKSSYLPRPFSRELLISPSQVMMITEEKMIVEDAAAPLAATAPTPA